MAASCASQGWSPRTAATPAASRVAATSASPSSAAAPRAWVPACRAPTIATHQLRHNRLLGSLQPACSPMRCRRPASVSRQLLAWPRWSLLLWRAPRTAHRPPSMCTPHRAARVLDRAMGRATMAPPLRGPPPPPPMLAPPRRTWTTAGARAPRGHRLLRCTSHAHHRRCGVAGPAGLAFPARSMARAAQGLPTRRRPEWTASAACHARSAHAGARAEPERSGAALSHEA
jgi:hypothetical protein